MRGGWHAGASSDADTAREVPRCLGRSAANYGAPRPEDMQKGLCRTATHAVRSGVDDGLATAVAVRGTAYRRTNVASLRGRHFMGCHAPCVTHPEEVSFRRLSFAYLSLARTPRRKSPWGAKKSRCRPAQGRR